MAKDDNDNASTIEILNGISQALSRKFDGATDEDGDPIEIGLRREKGLTIRDKRVIDGFSVGVKGNVLRLSYQSEIGIKEVQEKGFENNITAVMDDCLSFLKKEFRKATKKTLSLKMIDEPHIRVESMNAYRSWVIGVCDYEVSGLEKPEKYPEKWEDKLEKNMKSWLGLDKKEK